MSHMASTVLELENVTAAEAVTLDYRVFGGSCDPIAKMSTFDPAWYLTGTPPDEDPKP